MDAVKIIRFQFEENLQIEKSIVWFNKKKKLRIKQREKNSIGREGFFQEMKKKKLTEGPGGPMGPGSPSRPGKPRGPVSPF